MKKLFTLFLFCGMCFAAYGSNATFNKLTEVNKCWQEQADVSMDALPVYTHRTGTEWIRTHLRLVENTLRKRSTSHLTAQQLHNRMQCLNYLHEYWQTGNFPVNDVYSYQTPIFIDRYDNFCAVGYLIKASGNESISRMIAARTNTAYVREMNYPELNKWAAAYGFTTDELAWIQPSYEPTHICAAMSIGKGVDGYVNEMFVDEDRLFVGGSFIKVDGTITANNIAYVTEAGGTYTWHNMGTGVNGPVHAVVKYDNKIFVAGSFDTAGGVPVKNIAYWDGSTWHAAGCVSGMVYDLAAYEGNLFAAGEFDNCVTSTASNFAVWYMGNWLHIPGVNGRINTMEATSSGLLLGGAFSYDTILNVIKWTQAGGFEKYGNHVSNEVMDFERHNDSLYVACKRTDTVDTVNVFMVLRNGTWRTPAYWHLKYGHFSPQNDTLSLNTLCDFTTSLDIGGQFEFRPDIVPGPERGVNSLSLGYCSPRADSTINKMVVYKDKLIFGGKFKEGYNDSVVNGIAWRKWVPISVPSIEKTETIISAYPNPISPSDILTLKNNIQATHYTLHHITGKIVTAGNMDTKQQIELPQLPAGLYMISISNDAGERAVQKIFVE